MGTFKKRHRECEDDRDALGEAASSREAVAHLSLGHHSEISPF